MEDPITFELWAKVKKTERKSAANFIEKNRVGVDRRMSLRMIQSSLNDKINIRISDAMGWDSIKKLLDESLNCFFDTAICQAGYGPEFEEKMRFCDKHLLFFSGCIGCPVCHGRARAE